MKGIGKLTRAAVREPMALELAWDDGHRARVQLAGVIAAHPALAALRDAHVFAQARVSDDGWSLEWPNGIDFGSAQLRRWADEQAGEIMAPDAFRAWMARFALTQEDAARALGLSRRTIGYYLSGEKAIPKTVLLATEGWAARVEA
jgi:Protein of unknown function (DUF2442)/Helix-turn-helix